MTLIQTIIAAPPTIKTIDVLTLVALVVGPVLAVGIQLWFERRRELRRAKIAILDILMGYRGRLASPECVNALNRIQLVFYSNTSVISKHKALLDHMDVERNYPESERPAGWTRRDDLLAELILIIGKSLGYHYTHTGIKTLGYVPKVFIDESEYTSEIRKQLLEVTSGKQSISVSVVEPKKANNAKL